MCATRNRENEKNRTIAVLAYKLGFSNSTELRTLLISLWAPKNPQHRFADRSDEYLESVAEEFLNKHGRTLWCGTKRGLLYPESKDEIKTNIIGILHRQRYHQLDKRRRNERLMSSAEDDEDNEDDEEGLSDSYEESCKRLSVDSGGFQVTSPDIAEDDISDSISPIAKISTTVPGTPAPINNARSLAKHTPQSSSVAESNNSHISFMPAPLDIDTLPWGHSAVSATDQTCRSNSHIRAGHKRMHSRVRDIPAEKPRVITRLKLGGSRQERQKYSALVQQPKTSPHPTGSVAEAGHGAFMPKRIKNDDTIEVMGNGGPPSTCKQSITHQDREKYPLSTVQSTGMPSRNGCLSPQERNIHTCPEREQDSAGTEQNENPFSASPLLQISQNFRRTSDILSTTRDGPSTSHVGQVPDESQNTTTIMSKDIFEYDINQKDYVIEAVHTSHLLEWALEQCASKIVKHRKAMRHSLSPEERSYARGQAAGLKQLMDDFEVEAIAVGARQQRP